MQRFAIAELQIQLKLLVNMFFFHVKNPKTKHVQEQHGRDVTTYIYPYLNHGFTGGHHPPTPFSLPNLFKRQ